MARPHPKTSQEAEERFYAWYSRRFRGKAWINVLKSCMSPGVPESAHTTTIEEWREVARALDRAVRSRDEWEAREWSEEESPP